MSANCSFACEPMLAVAVFDLTHFLVAPAWAFRPQVKCSKIYPTCCAVCSLSLYATFTLS